MNFLTTYLIIFSVVSLASSQNVREYDDSQNMEVVMNQEAHYKGGDAVFVDYIEENMRYPEGLDGRAVVGEVMVGFDVMPNGSLENIVLLKKIGNAVDDEVIRVLKETKYEPSIQNGVKLRMSTMLTIPIRVRQE